MSGEITLNISVPTGVCFETKTDMVQIPAYDGDITILPQRVPSVFVLNEGILRVLDGNAKYFISSGVAKYLDKKLEIIVEKAVEFNMLDTKVFEEEMLNTEDESKKEYYLNLVDMINLEKYKGN